MDVIFNPEWFYGAGMAIAILWSSFLIDSLFGDPPNRLHPVRWLGIIIDSADGAFRRMEQQVAGGALFVFFICAIVVAFTIFITYAFSLNIVIYLIGSAAILKMTFAMRTMRREVGGVLSSMESGEIALARKKLSYIVRRDTSELDEHLMSSACIETVSEGFVDGVLSPLFFYGILGIAGSVTYRAVNTLDSMIGYNDERNGRFGKATAYADTIMNYVPARLSPAIMAIASILIGNGASIGGARLQSRLTGSWNAGWPMGSIALLEGVRLEKRGSYILNPDGKLPAISDARLALRIFTVSSIVAVLFASLEIVLASMLLSVV